MKVFGNGFSTKTEKQVSEVSKQATADNTTVVVQESTQNLTTGQTVMSDLEQASKAFGLALFSWDVLKDQTTFQGNWDNLLDKRALTSGKIRALLDLLHPEDHGVVYLAFSDLMHGRTYELEREARLDLKDTSLDQWILIRATSLRDNQGAVLEIHGGIFDITTYKTTEQQAAEMVHQDLMTGLPNRKQLLSQIESLQNLNEDNGKSKKLDVVVIDIDRFRLINDSLGETVGDEILRIVGERLRRQLRRGDMLARLGGDQFAFTMTSSIENETDTGTAFVSRLEKLRSIIADPIHLTDGEIAELETNLGVRRSYTNEETSAESLLRDASLALREAKASGSTNIEEFHNQLHEKLLVSVEHEKTIRQALQEDWIVVHYQPVIESDSGKPIGFEALVRIQHPEKGLIPPNTFIPVAEETGLITDLTKAVISKSMKQLAEWHNTRPGMRHMTMAINLSPVQFEDDDIIKDLEAGLKETGLAGKDIKIEVTESLLIKSMSKTIKILDTIKNMGIQICIDDFGTGYSSLSYIRNYSFDTLKIDRSFIQHITEEPRDAELVRSIIQMGQNVGMNIVVEGVEEEDQHSLLTDLGCHFVQGFLVAKPLPAEQVKFWLDDNNL